MPTAKSSRRVRRALLPTSVQRDQLAEGVRLFNAGKHWHAHEAWEGLWLSLEGDEKRFVQGLIMAAAMLVQYRKGVARGVRNHWANVQARLPSHGPQKWGIDVADLLAQLEAFAATADTLTLEPEGVQIRWRR